MLEGGAQPDALLLAGLVGPTGPAAILRLYRNLRDWVTVGELDVEIHFPKEGVVPSREPPAYKE